jgi:hypothetical protein
VSLAVTFACAFAAQQLTASPFPAVAGEPVTVVARRLDRTTIAALAVTVELPEGGVESCGATDGGGEVRFTLRQPGRHVVAASIDGVRTVMPLPVIAARPRWPLALGSVPLGLALVWWHLARRRRGAPD